MKLIEGEQERVDKEEWTKLILSAKQIGLSPEDVRDFIQEHTKIKET